MIRDATVVQDKHHWIVEMIQWRWSPKSDHLEQMVPGAGGKPVIKTNGELKLKILKQHYLTQLQPEVEVRYKAHSTGP